MVCAITSNLEASLGQAAQLKKYQETLTLLANGKLSRRLSKIEFELCWDFKAQLLEATLMLGIGLVQKLLT